MKAIAVLCMFAMLSGTAMAQSPTAPNSVYFEAAGNGLFYSANYDRLFTKSLGGRVGASYTSPEQVSVITFPLMAYYLFGIGTSNSKVELGLGACVILQPENQSFSFMSSVDDEFRGNGVLGTATLGYRYQRAEGGLMVRAGITPLFGNYVRDVSPTYYEEVTEDVFKFNFSLGMSVGYAF